LIPAGLLQLLLGLGQFVAMRGAFAELLVEESLRHVRIFAQTARATRERANYLWANL
jgi:hypothetical protein